MKMGSNMREVFDKPFSSMIRHMKMEIQEIKFLLEMADDERRKLKESALDGTNIETRVCPCLVPRVRRNRKLRRKNRQMGGGRSMGGSRILGERR